MKYYRVNYHKVIILKHINGGLMKIPDKERLFKELTDLITWNKKNARKVSIQ